HEVHLALAWRGAGKRSARRPGPGPKSLLVLPISLLPRPRALRLSRPPPARPTGARPVRSRFLLGQLLRRGLWAELLRAPAVPAVQRRTPGSQPQVRHPPVRARATRLLHAG